MSKIPIPEHISLKAWANELTSLYEADFLPILLNEEEWIHWGSIVASSNSFARAGVPMPRAKENANADDWTLWAKIVLYRMQSIEPRKNKIT